jgi:deazaflavin-dependent oxidoreductase (nitroreductase family)
MSDRLEQYRTDPLAVNQRIIHDFRASGGRPAGFTRLLLLTTTGARTGRPRTTPLGYARDEATGRLLLWASNMGAPRDPAWYRNLVANPDVTVELAGDRFPARARVAHGPERDRLLQVLTAQMPVAGHQQLTPREIPLVILDRPT